MRDKNIPEESHEDTVDFYTNGVEPLKPCCECECNNNSPTTARDMKKSTDSGLGSSLTNGGNRVTFELPDEDNSSDVFIPPSQLTDMSIAGEASSMTKMPPPASIARRRGASLTLDLKDRMEKPAPSRNVSLPMENGASRIAVSESEMKLQEYEIDKNEQIDKHFVAETEGVVRSFMISSYERETEKPLVLPHDEDISPEIPSPDETPIIPELFDQPLVQDNNAAVLMIARRLSFISAQMDARYGGQLDAMVVQILPDILVTTDALLDHAYRVFQHVASNLFRDGQITWCRIIALLSFGYRLGVALFRHGVSHFLRLVVRLVTKFIMSEHIYRWIIQRGGWFATLTYNLVGSGSFNTTTNLLFYSIWGLTVFTVMCFAVRNLTK